MCTRTLYVGTEDLVITGRNMDWKEDMYSNLWVFPAGMKRDGAAGPQSIAWTSRYGSVTISGYEAGTTDGMNEKGLVANILYLAESSYGPQAGAGPFLSIALWGQYVLDNFATVAEAVDALAAHPFILLAPMLPNGSEATLHLSVSDASGDSAIFEYLAGELVIHHGRDYVVMTNSPPYEQQVALNAYWQRIGGLTFLPGTNNAADRFARASFLLGAIPRSLDKAYIAGVPDHTYAHQAVACVMSVQRAVSVPLGITTPEQPNISSTIWRSVANQRDLIYYFDSATRPSAFWINLAKLDLAPGAPVRKLTIANGEVYAGEVSAVFAPAEPFAPLPARPEAA
ncbi:linear amide C-N hydrolase [Ancylobacter sp. MQZ15Z-1]|uniref:Linear amide C-N hydrolase n=1 Tax=Ancylobacter mangrovi TaxID=2972472 RepID=A0A9X2PF05_9HYPH|nr:linear amide C-N hydrolase [Ancylobacter mangrovi]MCS0497489.1 linear amide C-N hydrolase [Ancylobacter mangrovi]